MKLSPCQLEKYRRYPIQDERGDPIQVEGGIYPVCSKVCNCVERLPSSLDSPATKPPTTAALIPLPVTPPTLEDLRAAPTARDLATLVCRAFDPDVKLECNPEFPVLTEGLARRGLELSRAAELDFFQKGRFEDANLYVALYRALP